MMGLAFLLPTMMFKIDFIEIDLQKRWSLVPYRPGSHSYCLRPFYQASILHRNRDSFKNPESTHAKKSSPENSRSPRIDLCGKQDFSSHGYG
jgi:hypothetical protein